MTSAMPSRIVIHVVHGTWPRGLVRQFLPSWLTPRSTRVEWFEPKSTFCESLRSQLSDHEVRIEPFVWSGGNSQLAREKAALEFQRCLRVRMADEVGAAHFVIGHSHGGNVALLAISDLRSKLDSNLKGLICLATPFLTFLPLRGSAIEEAIRLLPVIFPPTCIVMAVLVALLTGSWNAGSFIRGLALSLFLSPLVLAWVSFKRREVAKRYLALRKRSSPRSSRLLACIRSPGDEATLALALPQLTNLVAQFLWQVVMRPVLWLADRLPARWVVPLVSIPPLASLGVLMLRSIFGEFKHDMHPLLQIAVTLGLVPVLFLVASFLVLAPAAVICALAIGPEMLIAGFVQEVLVDSTPAGWQGKLECVIQERRGARNRALRHSIYEWSRVRRRVANVIRENL